MKTTCDDEAHIIEAFENIGQGHIFKYWQELDSEQRHKLIEQLRKISAKDCQIAWEDMQASKKTIQQPREPKVISAHNPLCKSLKPYQDIGEELIRQGKVAAFTVAGGQGTRLGHKGPKGTFSCSPLRNISLFGHFAESIKYFSAHYGRSPWWFIMTSDENHNETLQFFTKMNFFGLDKKRVMFFRQGMMPVFDLNGNFLLKEKNQIMMSPNGHGGSFRALRDSGALKIMEEEGIDFLSYFQIDNPLVYCIDPTFVGMHLSEKSEMSSKAVKKINSDEKVGTFLKLKGALHVVEYSDIPHDISTEKNSDGTLRFSFGSIAIHLINRTFIQKLCGETVRGGDRLTYHGALKPVSFTDETGNKVNPVKPNALKAETFVFDALPLAKNPLVVEIDRKEEFAPIKNAQGIDSFESSCKLQLSRARNWLREKQDFKIYEKIEIAPSFAPTRLHFQREFSKLEHVLTTPLSGQNVIFEKSGLSYQ